MLGTGVVVTITGTGCASATLGLSYDPNEGKWTGFGHVLEGDLWVQFWCGLDGESCMSFYLNWIYENGPFPDCGGLGGIAQPEIGCSCLPLSVVFSDQRFEKCCDGINDVTLTFTVTE